MVVSVLTLIFLVSLPSFFVRVMLSFYRNVFKGYHMTISSSFTTNYYPPLEYTNIEDAIIKTAIIIHLRGLIFLLD